MDSHRKSGNPYTRRTFLKQAALTTSTAAVAARSPLASLLKSSAAGAKPNILMLTCEDMGAHLGCYGDEYANTPTIDGLAADGVRYTNACCVAGVCSPSRAGIITGMYPGSLGASNMRVLKDNPMPMPSFLKGFPQYLRNNGYYCCNNKKTDYQTTVKDDAPWDAVSNNAHWIYRPNKSQPFFAVFNFFPTHESQYQTPDKRKRDIPTMPPYYPQTEKTKDVWAQYYRKIEELDQWVKDRLTEVDARQVAEDTIVIFFSDHGVGLPRAKRWVYNSGIEVPFIVRIPEKFRVGSQGTPGTVSDELISMVDLAPTILNLAGVSAPDYMQGRAFLGANLTAQREYLYAARDRADERYDIVRSVRNKRYIYIRNYEHWKPYSQYLEYNENGAMTQEWRRLHEAGALSGAQALFWADQRPLEELYDLENDPHEINNLAAKPEHAQTVSQMRSAVEDWMVEIRDVGFIPEAESHRIARSSSSLYDAMREGTANPTRIHLDTMELLKDSEASVDQLAGLLSNNDPVLRYWAAMGLGNAWAAAKPYASQLKALLSDDSGNVRLAAARALCYLQDSTTEALGVLKKGLASDNDHIALEAANIIDDLGDVASSLKPDLEEQALRQDYVGRCSRRVIETIDDPIRKPAENSIAARPMSATRGNRRVSVASTGGGYLFSIGPGNRQAFSVRLYNARGREVFSSSSNDSGTVLIPRNTLAPGMYMAKIPETGQKVPLRVAK